MAMIQMKRLANAEGISAFSMKPIFNIIAEAKSVAIVMVIAAVDIMKLISGVWVSCIKSKHSFI